MGATTRNKMSKNDFLINIVKLHRLFLEIIILITPLIVIDIAPFVLFCNFPLRYNSRY